MIVSGDGYTIEYYKKENRITITLPQTMETPTNTISSVWIRNTNLTETDLALLLEMARYICER